MLEGWLRLAGICGIVMVIVLFCVIFGGYSSFSRSQNRIDAATRILTDACMKRQALLDDLTPLKTFFKDPGLLDDLIRAGQTARDAVTHLPEKNTPMDAARIRRIETEQEKITALLNLVLTMLNQSVPKGREDWKQMKQKLFTAQDTMFVAWKQYKKEVDYYNTRTHVFPGLLVAKIFGFNDIQYTHFSKQSFPASHTAFKTILTTQM